MQTRLRSRLARLGLAAAVVLTSLSFGFSTAAPVHAQPVGCTPPNPLMAAPECPDGIIGGVTGVCTPGTPPCAAAGQCTAKAAGSPLTPGAGEGGGTVTFPGITVGGISVPPFTETIPAVSAAAEATGAGVGECSSAPNENPGDLTPQLSGTVCVQLYAQILNVSTDTTSWAPYNGGLCSSLLPGGVAAAAGVAAQLFPNLPGTGSGAWFNNLPSQVYTGLYDEVVRVWGYVDGDQIAALGCDQSANACDNQTFAV